MWNWVECYRKNWEKSNKTTTKKLQWEVRNNERERWGKHEWKGYNHTTMITTFFRTRLPAEPPTLTWTTKFHPQSQITSKFLKFKTFFFFSKIFQAMGEKIIDLLSEFGELSRKEFSRPRIGSKKSIFLRFDILVWVLTNILPGRSDDYTYRPQRYSWAAICMIILHFKGW